MDESTTVVGEEKRPEVDIASALALFSARQVKEGLSLWQLLQLPPKGPWGIAYQISQLFWGVLGRIGDILGLLINISGLFCIYEFVLGVRIRKVYSEAYSDFAVSNSDTFFSHSGEGLVVVNCRSFLLFNIPPFAFSESVLGPIVEVQRKIIICAYPCFTCILLIHNNIINIIIVTKESNSKISNIYIVT